MSKHRLGAITLLLLDFVLGSVVRSSQCAPTFAQE
jgi:hypothetical protein